MRTIFYILLFVVCLSGCKATQTTTTTDNDNTKTRIEYIDRITKDTVYVKDVERVYLKGDTIYKDVIKYKYVEKTKIDTAYVYKCDTIQSIERVYIDKVVYKYKYVWAFYITIFLLMLYLIYRLYRWANKIC